MNIFVNAMTKGDAFTENGAVSNSSTGNPLLDYFAKCSTYRNRTQEQVNADMAKIFGHDPLNALKIVFYNRLVTRQVEGTEKVQRGQGQRDEFIKSLVWLESNYPKLLYKNLWLVPSVGCWKDLWYDSPSTKMYHYINVDEVAKVVKKAIKEGNTGLLAKFLPKFRSRSNSKNDRHARINDFVKKLCAKLKWTVTEYRKFKSENNCSKWQTHACNQDWNALSKDFNSIPGRALFKMISSKKAKDGKNIINRHGLESKFIKFIESKPVAKFTGFPFELYKEVKIGLNPIKKITLDKQFESLLEKAKNSVNQELLKKGVLCALDTSGSMGWASSNSFTPIEIGNSLGIFFSSLMEGHFKDTVVLFDNVSTTQKLNGTFTDKVQQIRPNAMGGTNFQSVIDLIVRIRKQNPNIPLEDYPEVLLVVSDMQFNPTNNYTGSFSKSQIETNYNVATGKLASVGLKPMTYIWWNVNGQYGNDFPSTIDDKGTILISGYDPSIVTSLLYSIDKAEKKKEKVDPLQAMMDTLNQEILNKLKTCK